MQVQLPIFLLSLLVHAGIYLTSTTPDRRLRLMAGLALSFCTWPAWYGGTAMTMLPGTVNQWAGLVLSLAPYYLPILSFLVYLRRRSH